MECWINPGFTAHAPQLRPGFPSRFDARQRHPDRLMMVDGTAGCRSRLNEKSSEPAVALYIPSAGGGWLVFFPCAATALSHHRQNPATEGKRCVQETSSAPAIDLRAGGCCKAQA
jgi:hypothetical protein